MARSRRSRRPRPKVQAAGVSGALATLIVYVFALAGVEIPGEVGAAIATVLAFAAGYVTPDGQPRP